jgi:hypothetical protein
LTFGAPALPRAIGKLELPIPISDSNCDNFSFVASCEAWLLVHQERTRPIDDLAGAISGFLMFGARLRCRLRERSVSRANLPLMLSASRAIT